MTYILRSVTTTCVSPCFSVLGGITLCLMLNQLTFFVQMETKLLQDSNFLACRFGKILKKSKFFHVTKVADFGIHVVIFSCLVKYVFCSA